MDRTFNICRIQRPGYVHGAAFDEVVDMVAGGLESLGCRVNHVVNDLSASGTNIVFGAHVLSDIDLARLTPDTVIYNFEQIGDDSIWLKSAFLQALARCEVWDYSARNVARIGELTGNARVHFVPVGYVPELTRIDAAPEQDIDVLFYGSVNERRAHVLEQLRARGLKVEAVFGVFGAERDRLIARAKVVLNLHYYQTSIFEVVRVFYLLANRKAVVAECHDQSEIYPDLRDGIYLTDYDGLADASATLVADEAMRRRYEQTGFECIQQRPATDSLRARLSAEAPARPATMAMPRRLNMGSGKDWRADFVNVDITPRVKPDLILNFSEPLPFGTTLQTERFGAVVLDEGYFDLIMSNDVLEHVPDLMQAMTSCLRLLREGGEMHVQVPYDLSYGAWQDPTHVRAFNERSWLYYTDWFWYMGWDKARFDLAEQAVVLSDLGKRLRAEGRSMDDIMLAPRAVDALQVKLRKRALTEEERQLAMRMRNPGR